MDVITLRSGEILGRPKIVEREKKSDV